MSQFGIYVYVLFYIINLTIICTHVHASKHMSMYAATHIYPYILVPLSLFIGCSVNTTVTKPIWAFLIQ